VGAQSSTALPTSSSSTTTTNNNRTTTNSSSTTTTTTTSTVALVSTERKVRIHATDGVRTIDISVVIFGIMWRLEAVSGSELYFSVSSSVANANPTQGVTVCQSPCLDFP
jgi:hypothetical protein